MSSRGEEEEVGCMENNKNRPRPWVRAIQSHSTSRHTPVNTPLERLTSTIASTSSPATRKFQTTPSRKKSVPEKQFKCHLSEETVSPVHIMVKLQVSFSQLFFLHLLYLRPLFSYPRLPISSLTRKAFIRALRFMKEILIYTKSVPEAILSSDKYDLNCEKKKCESYLKENLFAVPSFWAFVSFFLRSRRLSSPPHRGER